MKKLNFLFLLVPALLAGKAASAQFPSSWKFILDGYNDVWLADMVVDSAGHTYLAVNYTMQLRVPGLDKELPYAGHVHGLVIKLDRRGKAVWAHPFKSSWDNRINDLALAPNGDLLITGFGDGLLYLPGLQDTAKLGRPQDRTISYYKRYQGLYAARYTPDGERKWARYFDAPWAEGLSIAANKRDEVWLSLYFQGTLKQGNVLIDSISQSNIRNRSCIAVLSGADGGIMSIRTIGETPGDGPAVTAKLQFDYEDNLVMFGGFIRSVRITPADSLTNDGYYDGTDSYIARLDHKGKLLWAKKIAGQSSQWVTDIAIAEDNSIYATGNYSYECVVGDGVTVLQKSKYEYKSGYSFFYLHLMTDGELDFARYEGSHGYGSYLLGDNIAIDQNGRTHISGYFTDTVQIDGQRVTTNQNYTGYYSRWNGREMEEMTQVGFAPKGSLFAWKIDINSGHLVLGGDYNGDDARLNTSKGQEALPNKDHGRITYLVGGTVATDRKKTGPVNSVDPRETRLQLIRTFEACTAPTLPDLWLPVDTVTKIVKSPCGQEVKGMAVILFPNPTQGETKLKLSGMTGRVQLEVFSLKGQLLFSNNIEDAFDGQVVTLNLAGLANATYIVRVTHKGFQKGLKVVKL